METTYCEDFSLESAFFHDYENGILTVDAIDLDLTQAYVLVCPTTLNPRYVGLMTVRPEERFRRHLDPRKSPKHDFFKRIWIGRLASRGLIPVMVPLGTIRYVVPDLYDLSPPVGEEGFWVHTLIRAGCRLVNGFRDHRFVCRRCAKLSDSRRCRRCRRKHLAFHNMTVPKYHSMLCRLTERLGPFFKRYWG